MLAQVIWNRLAYRHQHHETVTHGFIPQGTVLFVVSSNERANSTTVIWNEMVLKGIPYTALLFLGSEQDIISLEELQTKYHNNRSSTC